jgi:hypothetical protein
MRESAGLRDYDSRELAGNVEAGRRESADVVGEGSRSARVGGEGSCWNLLVL